MARAGFPEDHAFATKPALALAQAKRALAAGIRPQWATGDEGYGRSRELREFLEGVGIGYVFAVPVDHQLTTSGGRRMRADQALHLVEPDGWNRRSCGAGAKGQRYYDWAWIATEVMHTYRTRLRITQKRGQQTQALAATVNILDQAGDVLLRIGRIDAADASWTFHALPQRHDYSSDGLHWGRPGEAHHESGLDSKRH